MAGYAFLSIPIWTISATGHTDPPLSESGTVAVNIPVLTISFTGLTGFMGETDDTEIPILTIEAIGDDMTVISVDLDLPVLEIEATLLAGMIIAGEIDLPPPIVSFSGFTGEYGTADLDIPALEISAGTEAPVEIPVLEIAASGYTGWLGTASLTLPSPTISATAEQYQIGTADLSLPIPVIDGELLVGVKATLEASLPPLEISASTTYSQNWTGTAELSIPVPRIAASGTTPTTNTISATLLIPVLQIEAELLSGQQVSTTLILPVPTLSASGYAGEVGTLAEEVPIPTISATGYPDQLTGTVAVTIPVFTIIASGTSSTEAEPITIANVYVVNTNNNAVTEYTNYSFNSFCYFNGVYLGAKSNGIFRLDQEDDAGTDIAMYIEKTKMDLGVTQTKRATDGYLNVNCDGEMDFKMIADDLWHKYRMRNGHAELRREKLPLGKGLKGQHLGFRFDNVRGSDVVLDEIFLLVEVLSRRVRSASYDS